MSNPNGREAVRAAQRIEGGKAPVREALTPEQWVAARQHQREIASGRQDVTGMMHNRYSDKRNPTS